MVAEMTNVIEIDSETSRIRAALVNSGKHTFAEAEEILASSKLRIVIAKEAATTIAGQAALLTAVATGARCFGEVTVSGFLDCPLRLPLPLDVGSLARVVAFFGGREVEVPLRYPTVLIGPGNGPGAGWSVQAWWNGWVAGVAPGKTPVAIGRNDCVLAGVAAGALAVGQAFLREQGDLRAGRDVQGISLWAPDAGETGSMHPGPCIFSLPTDLWLVGLGNLGQAYLWSLMLLPYPKPEDVTLLFQDDQRIEKENWGTSILVKRGNYGILKTRAAEDWALARGFRARRIDRRLDNRLYRTHQEPGIALAGLDSMEARRLLSNRGFDYVIDGGIGAKFSEYRKFRINVFDSASNPAEHFKGVDDQTTLISQELLKLPAYQNLALSRGDGGCGAAMLAERSVAVPFVSAFVGGLAITQAIRVASAEAHHVTLAGDSGNVGSVRAVLGQPPQRLIVGSALAQRPSLS
jgi:hypothetical protein